MECDLERFNTTAQYSQAGRLLQLFELCKCDQVSQDILLFIDYLHHTHIIVKQKRSFMWCGIHLP